MRCKHFFLAEIGVNLRSSSFIRYDFEGSFRSTIAENIRVGFTTTITKGFLLGLSSNLTGEYLTLAISNSGKTSMKILQLNSKVFSFKVICVVFLISDLNDRKLSFPKNTSD